MPSLNISWICPYIDSRKGVSTLLSFTLIVGGRTDIAQSRLFFSAFYPADHIFVGVSAVGPTAAIPGGLIYEACDLENVRKYGTPQFWPNIVYDADKQDAIISAFLHESVLIVQNLWAATFAQRGISELAD
ncbi:hypothetical protein Plhal304r1_c009g0035731 [Plasmopara halstedii]